MAPKARLAWGECVVTHLWAIGGAALRAGGAQIGVVMPGESELVAGKSRRSANVQPAFQALTRPEFNQPVVPGFTLIGDSSGDQTSVTLMLVLFLLRGLLPTAKISVPRPAHP